ncbi:MAG: hypothetical protein H6703_16040 [Myxococcales bacterium]|nr:hypothetical protein [Myxococcales bacterium]
MLRGMKRPDPFEARLVVDRLGAIEHAELTIRPLTLFFGPNGTNKTWTAYAVYGLLHKLRGATGGTVTLDGRELSRTRSHFTSPRLLATPHDEEFTGASRRVVRRR